MEKVFENRLRRMIERRGMSLEKCRRRDKNADGYGTYRVAHGAKIVFRGTGTHTGNYGASLKDVESFLNL